MDTRQLAAFCEVVDRKSFSQAAERLGVTQPAVSLQIRSLEQRLGIVGASPRHRGVLFEPFFRDEVILVVPPGHSFAGKQVTLEQLREEPLILMQEGAGVRQVIEDELRRGPVRLRDLDVRLELGLQESVKSAAGAGSGDLARPPGRALALARRPGLRRVRPRQASCVIVRWSLRELPQLLRQVGIERPFLIASERWSKLDLPAAGRWSEVPSDRIDEIAAETGDADGLVAVGGGSAIDLTKAISVATGLPVVSVPTTYSGAEWAPSFGIRYPQRRMQGGGAGAHLAGIVYDPELTLTLPLEESVGTAMNALAHCAEALYVKGRNAQADELALEGARTINDALPRMAALSDDRQARTRLLAGADAAGHALALAGL